MANLILQEGLSFVRYEADGTTNAYGVTFDYLTSNDIKAFVNGDPATYTYINASEIALDTPAESGDNVVLNRSVKNDARYVNFQDGGQIREKTLDLNSDQIFFMAQEAIDTAGLNLFVSPITGTIDMKGARVINVGAPIEDTDAMTFGSSKAAVLSCAASAVAAAASASEALGYKNLAQGYMNNAMAAATSAGSSAVNAATSSSVASNKAGEALVSANNAADSAVAAGLSSTNATNQAFIATTRASEAYASAGDAEDARLAAEAAEVAANADALAAINARNQAEVFRDEAADYASIAAAVPRGAIIAYPLATAPTGYANCDGEEFLRTDPLFALIGTTFGIGDGTTTANYPDFRGAVPMGYIATTAITGSGSVVSNNATFTAHGIKRTGFRIRMMSGLITGLATGVTYYAIPIDANTLAFATTYNNAIAGTKITISGSNTAMLNQWENPDARLISSVGGSTALGSRQEDHIQNITGAWRMFPNTAFSMAPEGAIAQEGADGGMAGVTGAGSRWRMTFDASRVVRTGHVVVPNNIGVNWIIRR